MPPDQTNSNNNEDDDVDTTMDNSNNDASRRSSSRRVPKVPPASFNRSITSSFRADDDDEHDAHHHYTGPTSWGRGIVADFRQTIGRYWFQEVKVINSKVIAVSFFLFIAVIAPSITFGAVYAKRTNNYMGAVELLLAATAWCGIFYAVVSGQPMMINGGTGPVLTFQAVTYELSKNVDVPFLTFNAWIGLWVAFYMLLSAFLDLNRFIQYATRFTDEIFAFLIISIFILDAIGNPASKVGLMHYFNPDHKHHEEQEKQDDDYEFLSVALVSLLLGLGTCFFALMLRSIKHSPFCCNDVIRSAVTDFAITISVVTWTLVKELLFDNVATEELNVPSSFAPTFNCCDSSCLSYFPDDCPEQAEAYGRRDWFVDLFNLNGKGWVVIASAGPAALAFILAFLDNGITWHIINHPSNRLSHGEAYNYDTCISAIMIAANSLLGLPWLVASTVPCMMHVSAMSEKTKDGQVLSVQESRLTGLFTHILVLASLMALSTIKLIPLPVLYGVFLFMGLVALPAQQFWQRILLFFMQPSKYPQTPYTVFMEKNRVHLYTVIQIFFFGALYMVKTIKTIAIVFPFFILLCIPVRIYLLPRIFESFELVVLDGSPEEVERFCEEQFALLDAYASGQAAKLLEEGNSDDDENNGDATPTEGTELRRDWDDDNDDGGKVHEGDESSDDEEDEDQVGDLLVTKGRLREDNVTSNTSPLGTSADGQLHFSPEMFEAATRRSGRAAGRRRSKTVSDVTGMFRTAPETNWSHV